MFELPTSKRVRREDLYSQSSSPEPSEPDEELQKLLQARLESVYGPIDELPVRASDGQQDGKLGGLEHAERKSDKEDKDEEDDEEEGFEFRLFAAPKLTSKPIFEDMAGDTPLGESHRADGGEEVEKRKTTRIILQDDNDSLAGDGAFVIPARDPKYYFASPATGTLKAQYESVALSGEAVRAHLGQRHWGLEVPWRVRILRISKKGMRSPPLPSSSVAEPTNTKAKMVADGKIEAVQIGEEDKGGKKKKLGKKRRIILRMRLRRGQEEKEKREKEKLEVDEREREKRTRRNREKKVKRKEREKAKKVSGVEVREGGGNGEQAEEVMAVDT